MMEKSSSSTADLDPPLIQRLGPATRQNRKAMDLTQTLLAHIIGVLEGDKGMYKGKKKAPLQAATLAKIEGGKKNTSMTRWAVLATGVRCSLESLMLDAMFTGAELNDDQRRIVEEARELVRNMFPPAPLPSQVEHYYETSSAPEPTQEVAGVTDPDMQSPL